MQPSDPAGRPPRRRAGDRIPLRNLIPAIVLAGGLILGTFARAISLEYAPQYGYLPDHVSFMGWSEYAFQNGPWRLYDLAAGQTLAVRMPEAGGGGTAVWYPNRHACNYPPLSAYVFWFQGATWSLMDPQVVPVPNETGRDTRVINTRASRVAGAMPSMFADLLLAWGTACLVGAMLPQASAVRRSLAFSMTFLAPPVFLDSAFWNQADAWIAALMVWFLVLLIGARWVWAGVLLGAALMTKPQAILLAPLLVFVLLALRFMPAGSWRRSASLVKTAVAALITILVIAAPCMLHDAGAANNPAGAWRWLARSYVETIGSDLYNRTTLNAFNIWWIDLVLQRPAGPAEWRRAWDPSVPLLGLAKSTWGGLLLATSLMLGAWSCAKRWRWTHASWVIFAAVCLLAAFALPTKVHERYVYFCIPPLIALACFRAAWLPPLLGMVVVGTFEMVSFRWLAGIMDDPAHPTRNISLGLALITVASLSYSLIVAAVTANAIPALSPGTGRSETRLDPRHSRIPIKGDQK